MSTTAAAMMAIRMASTSTPAHDHQRPRTSSRERRSAAMPRRFSLRSTGTATDQATNRYTPGTTSSSVPMPTPTPTISETQITADSRCSAKRSDAPGSTVRPR